MPDMLVNLLNVNDDFQLLQKLSEAHIIIRRAVVPDKITIVDWVKSNWGNGAASECDTSFSRTPVSCFIATREKELLGYGCYNATALNFFGPTHVLDKEQGKGIGKAILLKCLLSMRDEGYFYSIIGGIGPAQFYEKVAGAILIPHSDPSLYKDFLGGNCFTV
ncbi:MAG: GNAT family N-acetyltransferase [Treponemataceae bacterium]